MARTLALALVLALLAVLPAEATFPGRNGYLLLTEREGGKYGYGSSHLVRIAPRTGRVRRTPICGYGVGWAPATACWGAGPPAASPDGRFIAFAAQDQGVRGLPGTIPASVRVFSVHDRRWAYLSLDDSSHPLLPLSHPAIRWRPAGEGFLVLRSHTPGEPRESDAPSWAALVPPVGSGETRLAFEVRQPDVAADGRLAFVRNRNVHVLDDSGTVRRITRGWGFHPSWSPDGRLIAFSRYKRVFVVPSGGGTPRRLARGTEPVWSPDGRQIAFFRIVPTYEGPLPHLYVLSLGTGRVRRVSDAPLSYNDPYADPGMRDGLDWAPRAAPP